MPPRNLHRAVAAIVLALALSSCGSKGTAVTSQQDEDAAWTAELRQRPSFEQGEKNYEALRKEIRALLADLAPEITWEADHLIELSWGSCDPLDDGTYEADEANYDIGSGLAPFPEKTWPQIKAGITRIAADYGFTELKVIHDEFDLKALVWSDRTGATLEIEGQKRVSISIFGSCMIRETPRKSTSASARTPA